MENEYPQIYIGKEPSDPFDDSKVIKEQIFDLDDGRPATAQLWSAGGQTFLSYFFSVNELEDRSKEDLFLYLKRNGVTLGEETSDGKKIYVTSGIDKNDNKYWCVNIVIGEN